MSKHINVLAHYDDDTLIDKSGKLIKIIKLAGIDYVTQDKAMLDVYKLRRNNLFKNFSSEFAFYFWNVRRKNIVGLNGTYKPGLAKDVNDRYQNIILQSKMFHTELYLAVITKHPEGLINKGFSLLQIVNQFFDKKVKQDYIAKRHAELNNVTLKILSALSDYQPELLSVYFKNDFAFSAPLEMLSQLINFDVSPVPRKITDASKLLPRKRLFFNDRTGTIELRPANLSSQFAAMLSIKGYSPITYQGMLDELNQLPYEHTITQSFRFYDKQVAQNKMRDQQKEMLQTKDESVTLTAQINDAFDEAASGELGYGKHHLSLALFAESMEILDQQVAHIVAKFSDINITCVREDVAAELAYWAQLPGNFSYICRAADISTKNMAALSSLHNNALGKMHGNWWGDAVTVFETLAGSPYYFNFHYKDVGNFLAFGAMGSGKTVLVGLLILQSMKFGGKRIIFDKDRGLEIMVRAMEGVYERLLPGVATGLNPCQLADTAENRQFLSALFKKMLAANDVPLTENENNIIESAIASLYQLEKPLRRLRYIAPFFGSRNYHVLRTRFDEWHSGGPHAWLFDNAHDSLNLNADVIGFDFGKLLAHPTCKTPAVMYLLHRVEQALDGQRGMLVCDEGWQLLQDDYFNKTINDWSRTLRKKNNIFGLVTQVANDVVHSSINKSINESAFCKIFFPNPMADRTVYMEHLGLSEHEYGLVKTLPDDEHYFLLNHGRGSNKQSVVLRADLSKMGDALAIISAREETLKLFDQTIQEVGNAPQVWVPEFLKRTKEARYVH